MGGGPSPQPGLDATSVLGAPSPHTPINSAKLGDGDPQEFPDQEGGGLSDRREPMAPPSCPHVDRKPRDPWLGDGGTLSSTMRTRLSYDVGDKPRPPGLPAQLQHGRPLGGPLGANRLSRVRSLDEPRHGDLPECRSQSDSSPPPFFLNLVLLLEEGRGGGKHR